MNNLSSNKTIILKHEKQFAAKLAQKVLNKPKLSTWMIFIPFLFLFYIHDLSKFKKQRREFLDNYNLSREKALDEAYSALYENRRTDTKTLAQKADLKEKSKEQYALLLEVLAQNYTSLLSAKGNDFPSLVKSAYGKNRTNFLLFLNQLNNTEKALNKVLLPDLKKTQEGVKSVVTKIENSSEKLRRELTEEIFGNTT